MTDFHNYDYDSLQEKASRRHYDRAHEHLIELIQRKLEQTKAPLHIMDVGCGERSILMHAVEKILELHENPDAVAAQLELLLFNDIKHLSQIKSESITYKVGAQLQESAHISANLNIRFINGDFNVEVGTQRAENGKETSPVIAGQFDLIILNFVLHEIFALSALEIPSKSPGSNRDIILNPELFIEKLFGKLYELLKPQGVILFGDAYFPKYITSEQSTKVIEKLQELLKHADAPILFLHPESIIEVIFRKFENKFDLLLDSERLNKIEGTDCYRKSYLIAIAKKK